MAIKGYSINFGYPFLFDTRVEFEPISLAREAQLLRLNLFPSPESLELGVFNFFLRFEKLLRISTSVSG